MATSENEAMPMRVTGEARAQIVESSATASWNVPGKAPRTSINLPEFRSAWAEFKADLPTDSSRDHEILARVEDFLGRFGV